MRDEIKHLWRAYGPTEEAFDETKIKRVSQGHQGGGQFTSGGGAAPLAQRAGAKIGGALRAAVFPNRGQTPSQLGIGGRIARGVQRAGVKLSRKLRDVVSGPSEVRASDDPAFRKQVLKGGRHVSELSSVALQKRKAFLVSPIHDKFDEANDALQTRQHNALYGAKPAEIKKAVEDTKATRDAGRSLASHARHLGSDKLAAKYDAAVEFHTEQLSKLQAELVSPGHHWRSVKASRASESLNDVPTVFIEGGPYMEHLR